MVNQVDQYIAVHNRLHPRVAAFLQPYFVNLPLSTVKFVRDRTRTSWLGSTIWVLGGTVRVVQGKLNAKLVISEQPDGGFKVNGAIDLTRPGGMAMLAHELFHVKQWRETALFPWLWSYAQGIWASITQHRKLFYHGAFALEREAAAFEKRVMADILKNRLGELKAFGELR